MLAIFIWLAQFILLNLNMVGLIILGFIWVTNNPSEALNIKPQPNGVLCPQNTCCLVEKT
jgi:hypothetical protein